MWSQTARPASARTGRRILSRDCVRDFPYLMIFCGMVLYGFHSKNIQTVGPMASFRDGQSSFSPPAKSISATTAPSQQHLPMEGSTIPLEILTETPTKKCAEGLVYLPSQVQHEQHNQTLHSTLIRSIPKIIHMTSKSRCFTPAFADNIRTWSFRDHVIYLHDDEAVERLLSKYWKSFPHISVARKCLRSGAAKADLWRYLVLWEYGGIYTDIDNAPGKFWNSTTIRQEDDAFFVIERLGVLSQYFMALSPHHPLMYLAVQLTLHRLLDLDHVGKQNIPVVTGPGALKVAFKYFMRTQAILDEDEQKAFKQTNPNGTRYGRVKNGKHFGVGNRSVTIAGTRNTGWQLVVRGSVDGKGEGYEKMGMKHFSKIAKKKFNESCFVHLWNLEYNLDMAMNLTNW